MALRDWERKEQTSRDDKDRFVTQTTSNELNPLLEAQEKLRLIENELSAFNLAQLQAERFAAPSFLITFCGELILNLFFSIYTIYSSAVICLLCLSRDRLATQTQGATQDMSRVREEVDSLQDEMQTARQSASEFQVKERSLLDKVCDLI